MYAGMRRIFASRLQMPFSALKSIKASATFEDDTVNVPLDTITNSLVTLDFLINVVPSAEPEDWLRSQFLVLDGKPTAAGLLLFSDQPQAALPKRSAIKIYRYISKEEQGTRETLAGDPVTVEGCLSIRSLRLSGEPRTL